MRARWPGGIRGRSATTHLPESSRGGRDGFRGIVVLRPTPPAAEAPPGRRRPRRATALSPTSMNPASRAFSEVRATSHLFSLAVQGRARDDGGEYQGRFVMAASPLKAAASGQEF